MLKNSNDNCVEKLYSQMMNT